jgi:hypothetical protein
MVGLELDIPGGEEFHLSSPGNDPEPAADSEMHYVSQRAPVDVRQR